MRSVKDLWGYSIKATDGDIGSIRDLLFDGDWLVRYFVVDTGPWLVGRHVLLSPVAVGSPDWEGKQLPVSLTRAQVKDSPDVDTNLPVSRQTEIEHHDYYRWPYYWGGGGLIGNGSFIGVAPEAYVVGDDNPRPLPPTNDTDKPEELAGQKQGSYLYSARDVVGYKIGATDDNFGSVDDFLVEDGAWAIRYLVVDTGGLLKSGPKFLVAPPWIENLGWEDKKVHVDLPRAKIESAPPFDGSVPVERAYEERLYQHYGLPEYWREPAVGPHRTNW